MDQYAREKISELEAALAKYRPMLEEAWAQFEKSRPAAEAPAEQQPAPADPPAAT